MAVDDLIWATTWSGNGCMDVWRMGIAVLAAVFVDGLVRLLDENGHGKKVWGWLRLD